MISNQNGSVRRIVEAQAARAVASGWYLLTLLICLLRPRGRVTHPTGRIVVTGTFHNPGWFSSHATPLGRCGLREVIVVSHGPLPEVPGVRLYEPPRWLTVATGRTIAKLLWTIRAGFRFSPDAFMGYHLIPNSTAALMAGRLFGRPTCYQMTSGPIEVIGGGYRASENPILRRLRSASPFLERLATAIVGEFDLVIVRGRAAEHFVSEHARPPRTGIIPGSVDLTRFSDAPLDRTYDLIFVGQLVTRKQPLLFVETVAALHPAMPGIRAAIVGDGPMMPDVKAHIAALGLEQPVDVLGQRADVRPLLSSARVFVLPSRNEGLSIAMAEAMICGAVPVVANVGDLKDLVVNGETGYLVDGNDARAYAEPIAKLLGDSASCARMSRQASQAARTYNGLDRVSQLWGEHLGALGAGVGHAAADVACSDPERPASGRIVLALLVLVASFAWLYQDVLYWLVDDWSPNRDFSHGYLIPPLAAYFAWERRADLAAAPVQGTRTGLIVALGAIALMAFGTITAETFLTRVSIPLLILGGVLFVLGRSHARILAFPIGCLLLMIPIPTIIYNQITLPLQLIASRLGELALTASDVPVLREGNVILLSHATLEVAEACSGIRSLMSLLTLGIIFGHFSGSPVWVRIAIAASTVPIAIVCNGVRVAGTGLAAQWYGEAFAVGPVHSAFGWVVFVMALMMLGALQYVMTAAANALRRHPAIRPGEVGV